MRADQKRMVIEELKWHCDRPKRAAELLTEAEARDIIKRGYVTKELWAQVEPRLEANQEEE